MARLGLSSYLPVRQHVLVCALYGHCQYSYLTGARSSYKWCQLRMRPCRRALVCAQPQVGGGADSSWPMSVISPAEANPRQELLHRGTHRSCGTLAPRPSSLPHQAVLDSHGTPPSSMHWSPPLIKPRGWVLGIVTFDAIVVGQLSCVFFVVRVCENPTDHQSVLLGS